MAGRRLELLIVLSRAGSLAIAVAALAVATASGSWKHDKFFEANLFLWLTLLVWAVPWGAGLVVIQVRWLYVGAGEEPDSAGLVALVVGEWMIMWLTFGVACAALAVARTAMDHRVRATAVCSAYAVAAATACAAGALAAVSALGMLWILGSRFRPAQP